MNLLGRRGENENAQTSKRSRRFQPGLSRLRVRHSATELPRSTDKSQVVSLQTAHSWANAGVLLGDACIGSGVAFEAI